MPVSSKSLLEDLKTYILEQGKEMGTVSGLQALSTLGVLAERLGIEDFSTSLP